MTKVYVVTLSNETHEDWSVVAVFDNEEAAKAHAAECDARQRRAYPQCTTGFDDFAVVPMELNALTWPRS